MRKTLARILGIIMAAVLISTMAYGAGLSENISDGQPTYLIDDSRSGDYVYNCATGEEMYIPDSGVSVQYNETEGFTPGYDPYADEQEEIEDNLQTHI